MAREIIIYEQGSEFVRCMFVYATQFNRAGEKFPFTPSDFLEENLKVLLTGEELGKLDTGELSYQIVSFRIREGSDDSQRNEILFHKYRAFRREFNATEVEPKESPTEYLDLPEDRTPSRLIRDEVP